MSDWRERYSRQIRFAPIGEAGQLRLRDAGVLIAGCGALGASLAQHMTRSGVGRIVLVDRDYVELSNLHRQTLFDEDDVRAALPKAEAAAVKLRRLNAQTAVEVHVADMREDNIDTLAEGVDLIMDGTDNAATRLLLCDEAFRSGIPFVYGGATASQAMSAMLIPRRTACLRCLIGDAGEEGANCDTVGILSATVEWVAALQAAEAVKWLTGNEEALRGTWLSADIWNFAIHESRLPSGFEGCVMCGREADSSDKGSGRSADGPSPRTEPVAAALCGRDTVQVTLNIPLELEREAERLRKLGCVMTTNRFLVKAKLPPPRKETLVLFSDGRILVQGTVDIAEAEQLCDFYVGRANLGYKETVG